MNNRILKFRVWNLEDKCWDNPALLEVWDGSGILKHLYDYQDEKTVVQQFTGLLDKDRREIYEGDILRWNAGWFYQQDIIGYIKWVTNGFYFISEKNYCNSNINWSLDDKTDGKIIGNIFENEELIK